MPSAPAPAPEAEVALPGAVAKALDTQLAAVTGQGAGRAMSEGRGNWEPAGSCQEKQNMGIGSGGRA